MTRSWWGWGDEDDAVAGDELAGLAQIVASRFGGAPPTPLAPPDVAAVALPAPRVHLPEALAHLADGDEDPHRSRVRHAHGQAFRDVARAVRGTLVAAPDLVAHPRTAGEVAALLDWATEADVAVVPFGGGSSVVGGVTPPDGPTVTLDLTHMDRVVEVDPVSLAAHVEAGALGPRIEDQLRPHGLTLRHFPQSWEFSTLGGWIATRAGGHFATRWTHIDDLVESVGAETPTGRWDSRRLPASGAGPSPDRMLLGSEGTLGVITDAWVRVQRRPTFRAQASVTFPDPTAGARAVRALVQSGLDPANCRLLDPTEAALAGAGDGTTTVLVLGFESADHPLHAWMDRALELAADHGGACPDGARHSEGDRTGETAGAGGAWRRTFLRAPYLRDGLARLGVVVETFETAITWDRYDEFVGRVQQAATDAVTEVCGAGLGVVAVDPCLPRRGGPVPDRDRPDARRRPRRRVGRGQGRRVRGDPRGRGDDHPPPRRGARPRPVVPAPGPGPVPGGHGRGPPGRGPRRDLQPRRAGNPRIGVIDRPGRPPPHHRRHDGTLLARSSAGAVVQQVMGVFADGMVLALPVLAVVGLATLVAVVRRRGGGRQRLRTMGGGILAAALVLILATTLLPVIAGAPASLNLTPGATIRNYLRFGDDVLSARNLGLNIALFVPFGLGLALWRRWGVFRVVPVAVVLSVLVEGAQYVLPLGRAVDVDDVLLNTFGALLGALTVVVVRRLVPGPPSPRSREDDHPDLFVG